MTTEEFLKDVCPNHTHKSKWNKSELLYILELHTEQLRKHAVICEFHCERFDFGRDKKCEQQCSDCHWMQTKSQ